MSNITFDMSTKEMVAYRNNSEPWKITNVETRDVTMTGGLVKRIKEFVRIDTFCITYGDRVCEIDI